MQINKTKFWWGVVVLILLVLGGVNFYLFSLLKSMYDFIAKEADLSNKRVDIMREIRQEKD